MSRKTEAILQQAFRLAAEGRMRETNLSCKDANGVATKLQICREGTMMRYCAERLLSKGGEPRFNVSCFAP